MPTTFTSLLSALGITDLGAGVGAQQALNAAQSQASDHLAAAAPVTEPEPLSPLAPAPPSVSDAYYAGAMAAWQQQQTEAQASYGQQYQQALTQMAGLGQYGQPTPWVGGTAYGTWLPPGVGGASMPDLPPDILAALAGMLEQRAKGAEPAPVAEPAVVGERGIALGGLEP